MITENETITINRRSGDITVVIQRRSGSWIEDTVRTVLLTFLWIVGIAAVLVVLGFGNEGLAILPSGEAVVTGWINRGTAALAAAQDFRNGTAK